MSENIQSERTVVVATGNAHKYQEITAILSTAMPGYTFVSPAAFDSWPDPVEDGASFLDNALIKARAALEHTGCACAVADDSGLMVDALDGAPGIYSARWAGAHGDDAANNEKLLAELSQVPQAKRSARFCSCVVIAYEDGSYQEGIGYCEGSIACEPRGVYGFGYDPLFLPQDVPGRTMAELTAAEKNRISHRYHALVALAEKLTH